MRYRPPTFAWPHGDVPLEARARRPRPLVNLRWVLPAVSIFVAATFKGRTNSLPQEINVGRVVAGVGDAAIEMLLSFCRSGRQLFCSGGAAVMGIDAIGGPPHGDFTNESGAQRLPCGTQGDRDDRRVSGGTSNSMTRRSEALIGRAARSVRWFIG
jgi:hypothetical protein